MNNKKLEKQASKANTKAIKLYEELASVEIVSQDTLATSIDLLKSVKVQFNALDAERKKATAPLNESLSTINGWFKPATDMLKKVEKRIKCKVSHYVQTCEDQQDKALQSGDQETAIDLAVDLPTGVSVRSGFDFEVVDEDQIPRAYCSPDPKKIKAAIKAKREKTKIKGVRVFPSKTIAIKV